jgi:NADPH-dependent glutamate synthase beta subunit-like oxidoreductase
LTKGLSGQDVFATELHAVQVEWSLEGGAWKMRELPGTDFSMKVDLVLLAMGFLHVEHRGLIEKFGIKLDGRGNIQVKDYMTSEPGIFAAGDAALGASLVVRAIYAGRSAAAAIDRWLLEA